MFSQEGVFDRIEQSFNLLFKNKKNFFSLVIPLFVYKLIIVIFLWNFVNFVLLGNFNPETTNIFSDKYYLAIFILIIFGFLVYIIFFIGFLIGIIKSIKDIFEEKNLDFKENLKYGFNSIIPSFKTYWYIFAYIVMIPFWFILFGGIFFISGNYFSIDKLFSIGQLFLLTGFILLAIFSVYRGIKTSFSIFSAVDKNSYTKQNFLDSVFITDDNWWRILGNFFLLSILISLISGIISSILGIFTTGFLDTIDTQKLLELYNNNSLTKDFVNNIMIQFKKYSNTFYLNNFIVSIFQEFFNVVGYVFSLVFTYIFYKRLFFEKFGQKSGDNDIKENKDEIIEL